MHAWRGIYPSFGFQYVDHPGYNRDRGPVLVPTLRLHLEFSRPIWQLLLKALVLANNIEDTLDAAGDP